MAKQCVQCDKKIGLFKSPIDDIYCSYECRDAGRRAIVENEQRAQEREAEAVRSARAAEVDAAASAAESARSEAVKRACPKCGAAWKYVAGGGPNGLDTGKCDKCGFSAELKDVERCPSCRSQSLIIEVSGARCPRCKFRR